MKITIKVVGRDVVTDKLKTFPKQIKANVVETIREGTMLLKEEIQESIQGNRSEPRSVDTGAFLNSIQTNIIPDGGEVLSDVEHSIYLEFGTSKIDARGHFQNSFNRVEPIIMTILNQRAKTVK